jgi:FkbM family methyltransferase
MQALGQLDAGDLFVDIGAWIGPTALPAAARGARVVAFEPDPVARAELLVNIALNGLDDRITVHPVALANRSNVRNLTAQDELGDSMAALTRRSARGRSTQVQAVDVRSLLVDFEGARLVKIDIEGGEYALLPAMYHWLQRQRPDLMLSLHTYQFDPWLSPLPPTLGRVARRTLAAVLRARVAWLMYLYRNHYVATRGGWAPIDALRFARWLAAPGESEFYLSMGSRPFE